MSVTRRSLECLACSRLRGLRASQAPFLVTWHHTIPVSRWAALPGTHMEKLGRALEYGCTR